MSTTDHRVSVIVAATDARATVAESLRGFTREVAGRGEVVLVDASADGTAALASGLGLADVRVLRRPPGTLAPVLWTEGIRASRSEFVALTTAEMSPNPGWLDALLARNEPNSTVGVGGAIDPSPSLGPFDRAVYLQRYAQYRRPWPAASPVGPAGDNALYRRADLDGVQSSWSGGFWEVEVQHALSQSGLTLATAEGSAVTYLGGSQFTSTLRRRFQHARRYAAGRVALMSPAERLARTAALPLVPAVMLARVAKALSARGDSWRRWADAAPGLVALLAVWTAGEAWGTWFGPGLRDQSLFDRIRPRYVAGGHRHAANER